MARVTVNWVLPTTRQSGKPLDPAAIKHVLIEVSADGVEYARVGTYTPDIRSAVVDDVDFGEWFFRGTVVDTAGRQSLPLIASIVNEDTTPPGQLVDLTLTLS